VEDSKEAKVVINDVEYSVEDLSEEQRYYLAQVNDLRQKVSQLRFQLDQVSISEQHFTKLMIESVEVKDEEELGS
jgi:hypothetical protein